MTNRFTWWAPVLLMSYLLSPVATAASNCQSVGLKDEAEDDTSKLYVLDRNSTWKKVESGTRLKRGLTKFAYVIRDRQRNGVLVIKTGIMLAESIDDKNRKISLVRNPAPPREFGCKTGEDWDKISSPYTGGACISIRLR